MTDFIKEVSSMTIAMYICYMALLAGFGWLCYRFGFFAGRIEELQDMWNWCIGLSKDDPAPEDEER